MSVQNSPPIPVVQMGYVEKIADVIQNNADTQQHIANTTVTKEFEKQSEKILATEKSSDTAKIGVHQDEQKKRELNEQRKNKKQNLSEKKEEKGDTSLSPVEVFSGHLLNVKI